MGTCISEVCCGLKSDAALDRKITIRVAHKSFSQDVVVDSKRNLHSDLKSFQTLVMERVNHHYADKLPADTRLDVYFGESDPVVFSKESGGVQLLSWLPTGLVSSSDGVLNEGIPSFAGASDPSHLYLFGRLITPDLK